MRINSNKSENTELIGAAKNNDVRQKSMLCTCDFSFVCCGGLSYILHFHDCLLSPGKAFALAENIHDNNIITTTTITIIIINTIIITTPSPPSSSSPPPPSPLSPSTPSTPSS
jgi:hypothetical protein